LQNFDTCDLKDETVLNKWNQRESNHLKTIALLCSIPIWCLK